MKVTYELEAGDLKYITAPASPCDECSAALTCGAYCTKRKEWNIKYGQEIQKRQLSEYHSKDCLYRKLRETYYLAREDFEQAKIALQEFTEENKDFLKTCHSL